MRRSSGLTQIDTGRHIRGSRWTIARLIAADRLHANPDGSIAPAELRAFIARSTTPATEEPMAGTGIPRLYTLREVAVETGLSLRSLQDGARANPPRFRHRHIGGKRLMTREDIDLLVARNVRDIEDGDGTSAQDAAVAAELARRASRSRRPAKPTKKAA